MIVLGDSLTEGSMDNSIITPFRNAYKLFLRNDHFIILNKKNPFTSIRQYIHFLTMGNLVVERSEAAHPMFPNLTDLNITFGELLDKPLRMPTGDTVTISSWLHASFCVDAVPALAAFVASNKEYGGQNILNASGHPNWNAWLEHFNQREGQESIADYLYQDLVEFCGPKTLYSFFFKGREISELFSGPGAFISGQGTPLHPQTIKAPNGNVEMYVHKIAPDHGPKHCVTYEWIAEYHNNSAEDESAYATGLIFITRGIGSESSPHRFTLLNAAAITEDHHLLQAFLDQHEDAEKVIEVSNLCFVKAWERNASAPKGTGALCLKLALANLRKRFKGISTVIFDAKPMQFKGWDMPADPPMIAVEKQTAIDSLVGYIKSIELGDVDVRCCFNLPSDHIEDDDDEEDDDESHVWVNNAEELSDLLVHAGLPELAESVSERTADTSEVKIALTQIFLCQRIPFVPYLASTSFSVVELVDSEVPIELASNDPTLDYFFNFLPDDLEVTAVFALDGTSSNQETLIVEVTCDTPFGPVEALFTHVPLPRPMDISNYRR